MNESYQGEKRTLNMDMDLVQQGNRAWWNSRPMDYNWHNAASEEPGSAAWFARIDRELIEASHLFATDQQPFDRILPLKSLAGKRVLEIGCGMGCPTETMARAGAQVFAVDLTDTAVEMTKRRLELHGLTANIQRGDAEALPFEDNTFDFVWSWGVIHHSSRTGRIVRQIARVLKPEGECRVMVYNREGAAARMNLLLHHWLKGRFLQRSVEETLFATTDGFTARYYTQEQFEDLFRTFFREVSSEICGQTADVVPLPRQLRKPVLKLLPESYQRAAQSRRGAFLFLRAAKPE